MAVGLSEGTVSDADVRVPSELLRSLRRNPSSLLIKGGAGTGKTTLALSVLRALNLDRDFLYLSTRVSVPQILGDHPWLKEWLGDQKPSDQPHDPYLSPLFVDARLDEPTQLFEKITNQLMDASSPLIVVDAWDALRELAPNEPLEADMRVLLAWCERANAKLVVTSEDLKDTSLDSLVDAVVTLDQKIQPEGRVRELRIPKLRGIEIRYQSYLFTLRGGVFRSFEPYRLEEFAAASYPRRRRRTDPSSRRFSTGFKELDDLLEGGFRAGTLVGIELSPAVDPRILLLMLGNVVADFARSNRPARLSAIEGLDPEFVDGFLKGSVPRTKLRYVELENDGKGPGTEALGPENGGSRKGEPALQILGMQLLEHGRGGTRRALEGLASSLRASSGLGFVVVRPTEKRASQLLYASASGRMRLTSMGGAILVQPDVGLSKLLAFDISRETGAPTIELTAID
ncbi:MAG: hypothetical protein OK441_02485 [Thaumarchaeota archaeon]|nr:hypothetical protein [Nitrososphaerota archaeon]